MPCRSASTLPRSAAASGGAAAKSRRLAAKASPVDFDRVRAIVTQDLAPLATAMANQIASIVLLEQLDLAQVNPILEFDPRWPETEA